MAELRKTEGIIFKNVNEKVLECKTERVNETIQFMKTSNTPQT